MALSYRWLRPMRGDICAFDSVVAVGNLISRHALSDGSSNQEIEKGSIKRHLAYDAIL